MILGQICSPFLAFCTHFQVNFLNKINFSALTSKLWRQNENFAQKSQILFKRSLPTAFAIVFIIFLVACSFTWQTKPLFFPPPPQKNPNPSVCAKNNFLCIFLSNWIVIQNWYICTPVLMHTAQHPIIIFHNFYCFISGFVHFSLPNFFLLFFHFFSSCQLTKWKYNL